MSALERIADCHKLYGIRGLIATAAHRLTNHPKELSVRYEGSRVYLRFGTSDHCVYQQVMVRKEYEVELGFTPEVIVDAGANVGLTTIYYAHRYPTARIIAIEPEASSFAMLCKNVRKYRQVVTVNAALWTRDGVISIAEPDPGSGAWGAWGFTVREGSGTMVRAITLPTLMRDLELSAIDVLKIDIEGAEKEVFESCTWMDRVRTMVIETHDRYKPGCAAAVDQATTKFSSRQHGEHTVYTHHSLSDGLSGACA